MVLEHVTAEQGAAYLDIIKSDSPFLVSRINEFKENDIEGGPIMSTYDDIGEISPSTLRYLKVASDLYNLFGVDIGSNIAEIGGGYGGQLLINDKIFQFKEYHLFDLPPVLELASKYLESHFLNNSYRTCTMNQCSGSISYDLVISNYAFSELPKRLQKKYAEKVLSKARRGYLTMNSGLPNSTFQNDKLTIFELEEILPRFDVIEETPSCPGNYIVVWGRSV